MIQGMCRMEGKRLLVTSRDTTRTRRTRGSSLGVRCTAYADTPIQAIETLSLLSTLWNQLPFFNAGKPQRLVCCARRIAAAVPPPSHPLQPSLQSSCQAEEHDFSGFLNIAKAYIMVSRCPSVCSLERKYEILSYTCSESLNLPAPVFQAKHSVNPLRPLTLLDS